MRLLLDTHVLLWWLSGDSPLSPVVHAAIADERNVIAVSAASAWEIAIKRALGKLVAPDDLVEQMVVNDFIALPITVADALVAGALPPRHADPFDRMLVAQAQAGNWTLVTRDTRLSAYGVDILTA